ncbi:hypothetical protein D3C73_1193080 [compost metagenome]
MLHSASEVVPFNRVGVIHVDGESLSDFLFSITDKRLEFCIVFSINVVNIVFSLTLIDPVNELTNGLYNVVYVALKDADGENTSFGTCTP